MNKGKIMTCEKFEVQEAIIRMVNAIDNKNWEIVKEYFADNVFVDYSSMDGPSSSMKSSDLVEEWKEALTKATTHHSMTNFQVDLDIETCKVHSHVYACHSADGIEDWDIYGLYLYDLEKNDSVWKITSMTLILHGQRGNIDFMNQLMDLNN